MCEKGLGLLFPPVCPLCQEVVPYGARSICDSCRLKLPYINGPTCCSCGKEVVDEETEYCDDCAGNKHSYIKGFPAMNYVEPMCGSIAAFKYKNQRDFSEFYVQEIIKRQGDSIRRLNPDVLVPVPIHRKRRRRRGFNQAELLARGLGRELNIVVDTGIIKRISNTAPQKTLDNINRKNNLKNAFIFCGKSVKYNTVMLVDDIYTTGATVDACASVLLDAGVGEVYYTSICIGKGR